MKVAIYARYSSDNQRAASIEDQSRNCRKRADAEGWRVSHVYADEAISGSDNTRPQYQAMLAAAMQGEFGILLIDDLSRFARDNVEQETVIRRLEFQGIRILAISDGYDSQMKVATRKISRGIKGLMNEMRLDELREQVHRGQTGQAIKGRWNGGRPFGYKLKPILDAAQVDPYGQPVRIGTVLEIEPAQAAVVHDIFTQYADGASCLMVARDLNDKGVPSSGSTWRRKVRRCSGWMASAIRVIINNPLYTGRQRWNVSQFVRNPDTGKHKRRARAKEEWIVNQDEGLRIVSEELFQRAQNRTRNTKKGDERLKSGGKAKYLLSGILRCGVCGSAYVMANERSYACSSHLNGRACENKRRVRRSVIQDAVMASLREELASPEGVKRMARLMEARHAARLQAMAVRATDAPKELQEIDARLDRLRERLKVGDPDMTPDELQATIERVQAKREQLQAAQPQTRRTAKIISMLPRAAALYLKQMDQGLEGDPRVTRKARLLLREMLGGQVRLFPTEDGGLDAELTIHPSALLIHPSASLKVVGGTDGRDERI